MPKRTLILLIILVIILIGGGVWLWLNREQVSELTNGSTTTTTTNTNTAPATNVPVNLNLSLPNEPKGDTEIDVTSTIGGVDVHFSSYSITNEFGGDPARADTKFVIVYFDAVESSQVMPVKLGFEDDQVKLLTNQNPGLLTTTKIASTVYQNDRGYVQFTVPTASGQYILVAGSGDQVTETQLTDS